LALFVISIDLLFCQTAGMLNGKVVDMESRAGLDAVQIFIREINRIAETDENGEFLIKDVKPGVYYLSFHRIGYQGRIKTDIVVRPNRATVVDIEMRKAALDVEGISLKWDVLFDDEDTGSKTISYSREEIRRAPGSAGDVSRILMTLPSVAKVNDESNSLIVRGGNPFENAFYIDGIEVPNINHFPHQGKTGGPIGMLNVELINDVSFSSGGFSALYGDKLSSIMDISFREGSRKKLEGQLELSFIGFGGLIEGPLPSNRGSFILSHRRSYLNYVVDWFDVGSTVAPSYNNLQTKLVYEVNPRHKFTLLGIWADDHNSPSRKVALENKMSHFGNQDLYQGTIGLSWRALLSNRSFSQTSVSYTGMKFDEDWYDLATQDLSIRNRSFEQSVNFRSVISSQISDNYLVEYGLDGRIITNSYDNYYGETTSFSGDEDSEYVMDKTAKSYNAGLFINNTFKLSNRLTANTGLRTDYYAYNETFSLSPRFSASYALDNKTTIRGSIGHYQQQIPLILMSQSESNKELRNPGAMHYIAGVDRLLGEDSKLTLELYEKRYKNFPIDINQPAVFVIDEDYFKFYESLVDKGVALSRGVEVVFQKKLLDQIYGLAGATYFRSRYRSLDRVWYDRGYDNRFAVSIEGGYKPNHYRDFSIRWVYAGGVPYTPFDIELSSEYNRPVYDSNRINELRYPDYHSLNIRYDQRVFFKKSTLTFFLSVWNVYDRKNIADYFWNIEEQKVDKIYQWRRLPVFGIEYSF